jgi:adenosylhomocysteine nucleosidase
VNSFLILTAIELEARVLAGRLELPRLRSFTFPVYGRPPIRLAAVGVRAAHCRARWDTLLAGLQDPLVVSAGVCGALDPRLRPGDVVIPERVIDSAGQSHVPTESSRRALARANPGACGGALLTVCDIASTPDAKTRLRERTGAVAVDMESAHILARAAASGYPAVAVRAVSDGADEALPPELMGLLTPEGQLRWRGAVSLTVTHPTVVPRALTLRRQTRAALGAVARALAARPQ